MPNPVNPLEDFADKWGDAKYRHLNLEQNFRDWLTQARTDFQIVGSARDVDLIAEQANEKFAAQMNTERLRGKVGLASATISTPKIHKITETPARPWTSRS